jgi:hypothetical protein
MPGRQDPPYKRIGKVQLFLIGPLLPSNRPTKDLNNETVSSLSKRQ